MKCATESETNGGIEMQTSITYNFNKDQYAIGYKSDTTQKFTDKEVYDQYKSAQEETAKDTSDENVSYNLKTDDDNLTLVFSMILKDLDKVSATDEEKAAMKASKIYETNKNIGTSCTFDGIAESELK